MALTATQQNDGLKLGVGLFGAPLGNTNFNTYANFILAGGTVIGAFDAILNSPFAQAPNLFPNYLTSTQFATRFVNTLVGSNATQANKDAAIAYIAGALDGGMSRGAVAKQIIDALDGVAATDTNWGTAAKTFDNKVTVATYYSIDMAGPATDLGVLQGVIANVTSTTDVSTPAAIQAVVNNSSGSTTGQTFALTIGEDSGAKFTGTANNDTYNAAILEASGGGTADTLNSFDSLNGGEGTDALNATISGTNAAPVLTSIEAVNLRFAGDTKNVSLANATGVQTIVVEKSTTSAAGKESTVNGVGAATTLAVKNQTYGVNFDGSTATTLALSFDTAGKIDPLAAVTAAVDLGKTAASKATTLNITTNNANVKVLDTTGGDVATTVSIAATGTNLIDLDAGNGTATTVTITGTGSVSSTSALTAVTKLDASGNTGGVSATVANGAKSATVTGGEGGDVITMTTASGTDNTVSLGKGSDTLKVGAGLAAFTKGVDGGDGTDTISITDGSTLTATTAKYIKNFETLDVTGAGNATKASKGLFDVSLNSFATVQIAGALVGDVEFKNTADTFTLNINGAAGAANGGGQDKTDIAKNVTVTLKDAAGTTATSDAETFTLVARISDGNKDNTADGIIDARTITVAGVENLVIDAAVTRLDGGTDATKQKASLHTVTVNLVATEAETLTIKGDASVVATPASKALGVLTKVDASASTGNVTLDLSSHAKSVAYTGSEGVDTYTASTKGDTIYTGKGADVVVLTAGVRDTFVLKAATDSQIVDTNKDGKILIDGNDLGFDTVTFVAGGAATTDRLDLTNFGFTASQRGVEDVSAKVSAATNLTSIVDLFSSVAGDRGVAFSQVGGNTYVFVDANKDGDFTAANDLVIKLVGAISVSEVDINF